MSGPSQSRGCGVRAHLRYAAYVTRHKWFVFVAGQRTRTPLWRLLIHDWSKLTPAEWTPYVRFFYTDAPDQRALDTAWLHHQHNNDHHWQHWVLREDDGATKALAMPEAACREMVADWMGAGRVITGRWDVASWYGQNRSKIVLHPRTRERVEELIAAVSRPA